MAILSGPELQKVSDELKKWYAETRLELIKEMSQGHAFGSRRLTPNEQAQRFIEARPEDYEALIIKLNDKYRGLPNSYDLVNAELARYVSHMISLMYGGDTDEQQYQSNHRAAR